MLGSFGLLALAMSVAPAQGVTDSDRFKLFNNCEPMYLLASVFDDDETANDIGLTKERVHFAVESRLRGARLFRADLGSSGLEASIVVLGRAFNLTLRYNKELFDSVSGISRLAITWQKGTIGTHGSGADFIVSKLSALMDLFITEYLKGERIRLHGKPSACDPVAFDIERCFTEDLGTLQLSFFRPMI